jgi:hypothetical protein
MNRGSIGQVAGLCFGATTVLVAGTAIAIDSDEVLSDLTQAVAAAGGETMTVEAVETSGDDVVLSQVTIQKFGPRDGTVTIPMVTLTAPQVRAEGGFTASAIVTGPGELKETDNQLTWQTMRLHGAVIPSANEITGRTAADLFDRLEAEDLTLTLSSDGQPTSIEQAVIELGEVADGIPRQIALSLTGMRTGTGIVSRVPRLKRLIENVGYAELRVDLSAALTYAPETGEIEIQSVTIETEDFGTVLIDGSASGLPLSRLQSDASARDLIADTRIDGLTIRFENGGLVERGLDKQAELMGTTRQQLQEQMSAALPLLLNIIGNPAFQERLAGPATVFLQEPRSITFEVAPGEPVALVRIVSAALNAPKTLPDLLSVGVRAND